MPPPSLPRRRRGRARRRGPSREDPNSAATTSRSAHAPRRALRTWSTSGVAADGGAALSVRLRWLLAQHPASAMPQPRAERRAAFEPISQLQLTAAAHSFSSQLQRHLSSGTWQRTAELRATSTAATRRAASLAPRCIAIGGPARCSAHSLPRFPLCGPSLPMASEIYAIITSSQLLYLGTWLHY